MPILTSFNRALKRTASLLPGMPNSRPLYRGNPAITVLRFFLWLMPALFIPLVAMLGAVLGEYLPAPAFIILMLLLMGVATAGIGLFEEALKFQQMRIPPTNAKLEWVSSTALFVLLQIVIAPTICFVAILVMGIIWRKIHP